MKKYYPRIMDKVIENEMKAFGGVLINGPKWCGKTTTAKQHAQSVLNMQDPAQKKNYLAMAKINPAILLQGETPRLIDEWQLAPELWDSIRQSIDEKQHEGLYILTGSSKVDASKISHSGIGRISRLLMRTMSLYESNDSNGSVRLSDLFDGKGFEMAQSQLSILDIATRIVRGGWPSSLDKNLVIARKQVAGYINTIAQTEIQTVDGVERDSAKTFAVLKSLARHSATQASDAVIIEDVAHNYASIHRNTFSDYLKALRDLYIIEDLPAWSPKLRSKTTIRTAHTRHFIDPAFAASLLDANPDDLMRDIETFGLLFESLVIRDLRIYTDYLGGSISHYRDKTGLEADAIIHLNDGRWAAVEVKLGSHDIDAAAEHLIHLKNKVDSPKSGGPAFLMVVTGSEFGYQRDDGVYVVPIGCLRH